MEHLYKYRHTYGLEIHDKLGGDNEKRDMLTYIDEKTYHIETGTVKGEYPFLSVLWTCRKLHTFGIFAKGAILGTIVDILEEIKAGGGALPTVLSRMNPFKLIDLLKEELRPYQTQYFQVKAKLIPVIYGMKKTISRIDRTSYILISILSTATIYLLWRTQAYIRHSKKDEISVSNKVVLITGANSGIGERLAYEFVERGAYVIMVSSDLGKTLQVAENIRRHMAQVHGTVDFNYEKRIGLNEERPEIEDYLVPTPHGQPFIPKYVKRLQFIRIDLGNIQTIYRGVYQIFETFSHIDIIINNAATCVPEVHQCTTFDGLEVHFGVNYIGHYVLTNLILGYMEIPMQKTCRIINVICHKAFEDGEVTVEDIKELEVTEGLLKNPYASSKLCNYFFHLELTKRLKLANLHQVHTYAVCPQECDSNLYRYFPKSRFDRWVPGLPASAGMHTILYCALSPSCGKQTGLFYEHCDVSTPPFACGTKRQKETDYICSRLWDITKENTVLIMEQFRECDQPLERANFYGDAVFRPISDTTDVPFRPDILRSPILFRNYYTPWYFNNVYQNQWKKKVCGKNVEDFWEECHGPLTDFYEKPDNQLPLTADVKAHPIYDKTPEEPPKNNWMYF